MKEINKADIALYRKIQTIDNIHFAKIHNVILYEDKYFILEEFADGTTLDIYLKKQKKLTETQAKQLICDICDGLQEMHSRGLVHQNICPQSLVLTNDAVKIIGSSSPALPRVNPATNLNTLSDSDFAAPEQKNGGKICPQTDIYALGVLFNMLLTGCSPCQHLARGVCRQIISRCTADNPQNRYDDAQQLKAEILKTDNPNRRQQKTDRDGKNRKSIKLAFPKFRRGKVLVNILIALWYCFCIACLCIAYLGGRPVLWHSFLYMGIFALIMLIPPFINSNLQNFIKQSDGKYYMIIIFSQIIPIILLTVFSITII